MSLTISDDELVRMSTSDLKSMVQKHELSIEEHKRLRSRRRRAQNRIYARKCAMKKTTEVENLAAEVKEESVELQALRRQLNQLGLATLKIQHQESEFLKFRQRFQQYATENPVSRDSRAVRMFHADGSPAGLAYVTEDYCPQAALPTSNPRNRTPYNPVSPSSMPLQLAAGPGLPSSTRPFFSAWPPSESNPRLPLHLVRPVGCGLTSHSHLPEF